MCTCGRKPTVNHRGWGAHLFAWAWSHATTPLEKAYGRIKNDLFADLSGDIVEIGPGAGINFRHYPSGVHVRCVEPNPFMHPYLRNTASQANVGISIEEGHAEELAIPDNSVDAVVSTLVLCSVANPAVAIAEILRVLKPGGKFLFVEHVAAPRKTWVRASQDFIAPLWRHVGDGCNPNRETAPLIQAAGFSQVELSERSIKTPLVIVAPHIIGSATK